MGQGLIELYDYKNTTANLVSSVAVRIVMGCIHYMNCVIGILNSLL